MANETGKFRKKRKAFSQVSNIALTDKNLSLKAKGLYALIESFISIPDFVLYKTTLMNNCKEGKDAFDATWKELKTAGYLKQYKIQSQKGFVYEYELLDEPDLEGEEEKKPSKKGTKATVSKIDENQLQDINNFPTPGFSTPGESTPGESTPGKPTSGKVGVFNNTDLNNTNQNNTNINNNININSTTYTNRPDVVVSKISVSEDIFLEKIVATMMANVEAGNYSPDSANKVIKTIMSLCLTLNSEAADKFNSLETSEVEDIYNAAIRVYGFDVFSPPPAITVSKEAYILGIIKNKIAQRQ